MAGTLLEFYQKQGWKLLEAALQLIVGRTSEYAVEEALYRKHVIEAGWNALPEAQRRAGRARLHWDAILLALRREVFEVQDRKLLLRRDARDWALAVIAPLLANAKSPSSARLPPPGPSTVAAPAATRPRSGVRLPPAAGQPAPAVAIGIDFGSTYSSVAHLDPHGRPVSLPNVHGDILTPSVVLFDGDGAIVGKEAVTGAAVEPEKVADLVKRDMGRKFYRRKVNGWDLPPEAIAAFILRSLRDDAQRRLGMTVKAVITVPAYFDELRRRATMTAGQLIDLEVLDILNEPTAAALAYGCQEGFLDPGARPASARLRVLVFDLGGGTCDATIIDVTPNAFKTIATEGDVYLGGKDFDEKLATLAAERFTRMTGGDPRTDPISLRELQASAENAKRALSERTKAPIVVSHLGQRLKVEVTRQEFEDVTAALLARLRGTVEAVVRQAHLNWPDIDRVLLVGGATRMPQITRMLQQLTGKLPDSSINPDEAVAHGAALYADLLLRRQQGGPSRFSVTNVNAHSLGIVGVDGKTGQRRNQVLIPRNTPLPHTVTRTFKTSAPNQKRVTVRVVEGESEKPEDCFNVGVATIADLPHNLPAGWPVLVSYSYLENGQLLVSAKVEGQNAAVSTTFQRDNNLADEPTSRWNAYVEREWTKRNA